MFTLNPDEKPSRLDPLIDDAIMEIKGLDASSEEYQTVLSSLRILMELKAAEPQPKTVSPDTLAIVAGNLVGVALILIFETRGIINSKGMNFVIRPRT